MVSSCYRYIGRRIAGNLILEELKRDGVKITEGVIKSINDALDRYNFDAVIRGHGIVAKVADLPELCKMYGEVKSVINAQ
jgi:glucokinase